MEIRSRIKNVAARIRDTLSGRTDQAANAWENEHRESGRASDFEAARQDYAERKSEEYRLAAGIERAEHEGIARAERNLTAAGGEQREERARSTFAEKNPDAYALINKLAAIANDQTMDGPAADRAIDAVMTEHQRQKLGLVDRGDVYGITVRDQRDGTAADLTLTAPKKRETIRSASKDDQDYELGD